MKLILLAMVMVLSGCVMPAAAYYVPQEHMAEAQAVHGTFGWYQFGMKYADQHWGMDILRQMAMQETNNGRVETLVVIMETKYKK